MGYGIKIDVPRPLHYVARSPGYITGTTGDHCLRGSLPTTSLTFYLKLPYIGRFSVIIRKKIVMIWVSDYFFFLSRSATCLAWTTLCHCGLRAHVVYKFTCTSCNICYVRETVRNLSIRVREYLSSDEASQIFKRQQNSEHFRVLCWVDCFHV